MFNFVKDVIQGNEFSPSLEEQRRRYIRDERLCHDSWFCQKVLIIFTEGPYPYQSIVKIKDPNAELFSDEVFLEKRVYWGSRENLTSVPPLGLFKVKIRELQVNLKLQRANVSLLVKET